MLRRTFMALTCFAALATFEQPVSAKDDIFSLPPYTSRVDILQRRCAACHGWIADKVQADDNDDNTTWAEIDATIEAAKADVGRRQAVLTWTLVFLCLLFSTTLVLAVRKARRASALQHGTYRLMDDFKIWRKLAAALIGFACLAFLARVDPSEEGRWLGYGGLPQTLVYAFIVISGIQLFELIWRLIKVSGRDDASFAKARVGQRRSKVSEGCHRLGLAIGTPLAAAIALLGIHVTVAADDWSLKSLFGAMFIAAVLFIVPYGLLRSVGWVIDGFMSGGKPSEDRSLVR